MGEESSIASTRDPTHCGSFRKRVTRKCLEGAAETTRENNESRMKSRRRKVGVCQAAVDQVLKS